MRRSQLSGRGGRGFTTENAEFTEFGRPDGALLFGMTNGGAWCAALQMGIHMAFIWA